MEPLKTRCVYTAVRDMDLVQPFYETLLGMAPTFRDRAAWCQFKVGATSFALSSPEEAAAGARGSIVVFEASDTETVRQRIEPLGGRQLGLRGMGAHGTVATFCDPENNLFQIWVPARKDQP
jgi:predicted enzyme related to lactoylglutathione lyase